MLPITLHLSQHRPHAVPYLIYYLEESCTLDFWDLQFWQALATRWRFRVGRVGSCAVLGYLVASVDISQWALSLVTVFDCYCWSLALGGAPVV